MRPGIIECDWTLEDDLKLVDLLNFYGKNWKEIEERFDGRNINHIKNRYYGRIKKLNERKISNEEIC